MTGLAATASRNRVWFFAAAFLLCSAMIKPVQDRVDARFARSPSVDPDMLYFASLRP